MAYGLYADDEEVLSEIDDGDWKSFENWVLRRVQDTGAWRSYETPASGDKGADAVFKHRDRQDTVRVQAKHTSNSSSETDINAVDEVIYARSQYDDPHAKLVVITNSVRRQRL